MNNRTLFTELDGLDGRPEAPPAPVTVLILLVVVVMLALAGIIRLAQLRGSGELLARFVAPPATSGDYAYGGIAAYTERYWQAAAARESGRQASAGMSEGEMYRELYAQRVAEQQALLAKPPALFVAGPATYTDRYWQMAAAREARLSATSAAPGAPTVTEYASYTDRYWQMAAEREAKLKLASLEP
jgi:hypothetical protein